MTIINGTKNRDKSTFHFPLNFIFMNGGQGTTPLNPLHANPLIMDIKRYKVGLIFHCLTFRVATYLGPKEHEAHA